MAVPGRLVLSGKRQVLHDRFMRSLRSRLLALWLMLALSGTVTGFLLLEFYRQSANAQVGRAEDAVARSCRDIADRYAFFVSGWRSAGRSDIDDRLRRDLVGVIDTALSRAAGVEGGVWQADHGPLAYAFPSYEGTGPKTDVPAAEVPTIRQVNADALRGERPVTMRQPGRSQVLVVHACPLPGPLAGVTGWTMTRAFIGQGRAYNQLLAGLVVLAATVIGSAAWLGQILVSWSRKLARLEAALAARDGGRADLPALPTTGERELDRLVDALNATGTRLADEQRRATAAERLAAVGRLAAGLAHEIRNPIAAMRLKAENALASNDEGRRAAALQAVLQQVARLDGLLRDLLAMTRQHPPRPAETELASFLGGTIEAHRELAAAKGVGLQPRIDAVDGAPPHIDAAQIRRALDNLILNAIQSTPSGGSVSVEAGRRDGRLFFRVRDTGPGIPPAIRERLFEPFVTGRPEGTGLGLPIAREIARAHGGEARLLSDAGGAVFEIEVPWQPS
jgi:signal transduction histidine kinase